MVQRLDRNKTHMMDVETCWEMTYVHDSRSGHYLLYNYVLNMYSCLYCKEIYFLFEDSNKNSAIFLLWRSMVFVLAIVGVYVA